MIELRSNKVALRARPSSNSSSPGTVIGYAARFSAPGDGPENLSEDLGGFFERVARTAFDRSLREGKDVCCLQNHDPNYPLGRLSNHTLRLSTLYAGLHMECDLPDTSYGRDCLKLVQRSDLSQMSFAFSVDTDGDSWAEEVDPNDRSKRIMVRCLRSVSLKDTSIVLTPAYPSTSVSAVSNFDAQSLATGVGSSRCLPETCPVEFRSKILAAQTHWSKSQESRRRLLDIVLS
jgi:HK97 family phage prohead protease